MNSLITRLNVAFYHYALYQIADVFGNFAAVQNFGNNPGLFIIAFVGIRMVGVYNAGRIF